MTRAVLFDVDGTLVDSNYFHVLAWFRAFREAGHQVPMTSLHHLIGQGSERLVATVLDREDQAAVDGHSKHYSEVIDQVPAFGGAADLLRAVKASGLAVVLASSASAEELETLRSAIDADDAIDHATSKDDAEESKPEPDIITAALEAIDCAPGDAILIGDTVWDVEAAARAGVPCIGVLTGGISAAELRDAGAVEVYDHVADLRTRLKDSAIGALAARD
jgi:HAD superfamily hydrolase (TIGR01509 family)